MPLTPSSPSPRRQADLAETIVTLAGTPDDASVVDDHLRAIARLAVDWVAGVAYASVTALRDGGYTTVAASSDLIVAVDDAQYAEAAGPCVQSVDTELPVVVPDIGATMSWPGFCEAALGVGLHASVSIPLYAGRGAPVAVLNLYGHDATAMAPLIRGVTALYDPCVDSAQPEPDTADPGAEALLDGLAEAIAARATIQVAIAAVAARSRRSFDDAYVLLRLRAAESGGSLTSAATAMITRE